MKSDTGTYAVIFHCPQKKRVRVGKMGHLVFPKGHYVYIGSAFGPGGVRARVARHCRSDKKVRWHVDHLRKIMSPVSVWYTHDLEKVEHQWARTLSHTKGARMIRHFGCSDCDCLTHLVYFKNRPGPFLLKWLRACQKEVEMQWSLLS